MQIFNTCSRLAVNNECDQNSTIDKPAQCSPHNQDIIWICLDRIHYLSNSTKISTKTKTATLSTQLLLIPSLKPLLYVGCKAHKLLNSGMIRLFQLQICLNQSSRQTLSCRCCVLAKLQFNRSPSPVNYRTSSCAMQCSITLPSAKQQSTLDRVFGLINCVEQAEPHWPDTPDSTQAKLLTHCTVVIAMVIQHSLIKEISSFMLEFLNPARLFRLCCKAKEK